MKNLVLTSVLFLVFGFSFSAMASLKIAFTDQNIGQSFDSSNPLEKRSFIGLNLSSKYFASRCFEPQFSLDSKTGKMKYQTEWEILGSSWYGPYKVHFWVEMEKSSETYYTVRSKITNNGITVSSTSFIDINKQFMDIDYGTTFDADLFGENVDRVTLTPALVMATCP